MAQNGFTITTKQVQKYLKNKLKKYSMQICQDIGHSCRRIDSILIESFGRNRLVLESPRFSTAGTQHTARRGAAMADTLLMHTAGGGISALISECNSSVQLLFY